MVRRIALVIALVIVVLAVAGVAVAAVGIGSPESTGDEIGPDHGIDPMGSTQVVVGTRARVVAPEDPSEPDG